VSSFRVVEEVSRHDSAAGWNLNLSVAIDYVLAWFPDHGAEDILSTPDLILAGVFVPSGHAVPAEGGYRVSGQWRFVSGCQHARWILVACLLMDGGHPRLDAQGRPTRRFVVLPAAETEVLDTWHTLGMRGTGSHDVRVANALVPAERTAPMVPLQQPGKASQGALYRLTVWPPIALLAPPALGIARVAIDDARHCLRRRCIRPGARVRRRVRDPQRAELPAVLQGCAHHHVAHLRLGAALRVGRGRDVGCPGDWPFFDF
jgi:indole-3-acetate monooxygenase